VAEISPHEEEEEEVGDYDGGLHIVEDFGCLDGVSILN
jgi:hypothetical protein